MSKLMISEVDDVIEDEDVDDVIDYEEVDNVIEDYCDEEEYYLELMTVDISKLKPDDRLLFPNISEEYYDSIRWLINPQDVRVKPAIEIFGSGPSDGEDPEYSCGTLPQIQLGQHLDVLSLSSSAWRLLRIGGDNCDYIQPEILKDKYVVFVCVFAPLRWAEYSCRLLCPLRILSQELSDAVNFEMVIVPKMRRNCEGHKSAFETLLSAFPGRLFVPFEDELVRDEICQRLDFRGTLEAILVDTTHKVVQNDVFDIVSNCYYSPSQRNYNDTYRLECLSPDWIRTKENYLYTSLAELLDPFYCDPTLCLHSLASSSSETITVGELSNKLVGIYIFQVGDKLDSLLKVYLQCREKGLDFEIVVVCNSLFDSLDPIIFREVAIGEIKKRIPCNTPWWVLPYNAAACATLWNMTLGVSRDSMFTVGPSRRFFVDVHGGEVVHRFGIQAYPFNREMIVRKYELGAKAITLDSLLSYGPVDYVLRGTKQVPIADLYDRVVVLYTGWRLDYKSYTYKCLCKWYKEIRKQHSDFEVVFVYYSEPQGSSDYEKQHSSYGLDLLVRPFDPDHSSFSLKHESFFMGENGHGYPLEGVGPDSRLLFGKGGRLCALNAVLRFESYGLNGYPYESGCGDDYMRGEITYLLLSLMISCAVIEMESLLMSLAFD